jgi:hypothetical protein
MTFTVTLSPLDELSTSMLMPDEYVEVEAWRR